MLINRKNYESYFLDYIEGRLTSEEEAGLVAFLSENPDLKEELESFDNIQLSPGIESFSEKKSLKKNISGLSDINEQNFSQYCIAKMEGDLDEASNATFEKYLAKHPEHLKDYKLFLQTFLEPDKNVYFSDKQKLKHLKLNPTKNRVLKLMSVAAAISLIIISYKVYNGYRNQDKRIYTSIHEKLKIDSLLIANILGPAQKDQIAETKQTTKKKVKGGRNTSSIDSSKRIIPLRPHRPIEIVELESSMASTSVAPMAPRPENMPIAPVENRQAYISVREYASKELKKRLDIEPSDFQDDQGLWKVAQTGVKQLNKIMGSNIRMKREVDSVNNRTKVIIQTNLLSFYTSSKK